MRLALAIAALLIGFQAAKADEIKRAVLDYRHGRYQDSVAVMQPMAQDGNPYAQFNIAAMYDDGLGLPQNFTLALKWYRRAAEAGLVDAQYMLGRFYGSGRGMPQNPGQALFWFDLARAGGHPRANKLRNQHWDHLRSPQRDAIEAEATRWHAAHPQQFTCSGQPCIYPRWTPIPQWTPFEQEFGPE